MGMPLAVPMWYCRYPMRCMQCMHPSCMEARGLIYAGIAAWEYQACYIPPHMASSHLLIDCSQA